MEVLGLVEDVRLGGRCGVRWRVFSSVEGIGFG